MIQNQNKLFIAFKVFIKSLIKTSTFEGPIKYKYFSSGSVGSKVIFVSVFNL